jgi:MFS family permease
MSIGETTPGQAAPGRQSGDRRRPSRDSLVLAIACVGQFMVVLDVSIVTVALPSIGRDLHYTASRDQATSFQLGRAVTRGLPCDP